MKLKKSINRKIGELFLTKMTNQLEFNEQDATWEAREESSAKSMLEGLGHNSNDT